MNTSKLFQYAVIWHPNEEQVKQNAKPKVLVKVTEILAKDVSQVNILAARSIDKEYLDQLEQIEIVVRPF